MGKTSPRPIWNVKKLAADMAVRGWGTQDLAERAGIGTRTVARFLTGSVQTTKTAQKLADGLGHSVKRYFRGIKAV
jgi:transcriptional regulator with XRE-family HTH domain